MDERRNDEAGRGCEEVVFDERRAFEKRAPGVVLLDLTLAHRVDRRCFGEAWALRVKNVHAARDGFLAYSLERDAVELVEQGCPIPVLSCKIEL